MSNQFQIQDLRWKRSRTSYAPLELVLTEQRLHHLSLLKLDHKLDSVLSRLDGSEAEGLTLENSQLREQLDKSRSDFCRLEGVLNTTQRELSDLKADMERALDLSRSEASSQTVEVSEDKVPETAVAKRVLKRTYKRLRTAFSEEDRDAWSTEEVLEKIAAELRDMMEF